MRACIERIVLSAMLVGPALLGGAWLAPSRAGAQSAVETVAFMLWGLQEGTKVKRVSETFWAIEDQNGDRSTFTIVRLTDCLFHVFNKVQRAGVDVLEFDYVLNFAAVDDYSAWLANGHDRRVIVKIEGRGWYSKKVRSNATGRVVYSISAGNLDAYVVDGASVARLQSMFAYFRSAFCRDRH